MDIEKICGHVRNGGILIYPTDTLYGMGADPFNEKAIIRIFELKKMQPRVMSVAFPDFATARKYADIPHSMSHLFPAPLTVIARSFSSWKYISLHGKMGVRIPDNSTALEILKECGALTATSANIHNGPNLDLEGIKKTFGDEEDVLIIEGEEPKYMQPSTIIDIVERRIIRAGAYPAHRLEPIIRKRPEERDRFPPGDPLNY